MERGVGAILQEARNRRKVELSEVEAATRIRLRFLSAIENEEWDVLPGGVYTRGFIRTYASFLGLDGERLAADYRQSVEGGMRGAPDPAQPAAPAARPDGAPRRRLPAPLTSGVAIAAVIAVAIVAVVAIPNADNGSGGGGASPSPRGKPAQSGRSAKAPQPPPAARHGVSVRLAASAEVWVCILDASGEALVDGQILEAGAEEGPFHSGSFTVSLGNGEVSMLIDGKEAEIPATPSPIGYAIDSSGALTELSETERPSCT